ncbi:SnoaL-like domain-containing protein [Paraburkholderia fungorum]|uniref:SnoaL-like domain-containing protein n=1 Tax=Paraburkholderia fungorum TaxID=134537 RepID=A0A1H1JVQ2_9BURK|nr:nuclear transport factor 2 family protein [Paraburkholderia fungorum]SDR53799.1 SnoaL-like domain-containing protein [Paraburkholderia fungorum]
MHTHDSVESQISKAIQAALVEIQNRWEDGDIDGVVELFDPFAVIGGEGEAETVEGRTAIYKRFAEIIDATIPINVRARDIRDVGESCAASWIDWKVKDKQTEEIICFKSLTVWAKSNPRWVIVADMFIRDLWRA